MKNCDLYNGKVRTGGLMMLMFMIFMMFMIFIVFMIFFMFMIFIFIRHHPTHIAPRRANGKSHGSHARKLPTNAHERSSITRGFTPTFSSKGCSKLQLEHFRTGPVMVP